MLAPWKKSYDQPRQHIKKQRHYFVDKGPSSQSHGFSSSPVWMWELDYKESWALKNWWFWIVVLEKTLESPLNINEIKPVIPAGGQREELHPWQRSWGSRLRHTQRWIEPQETPCSWASTPKTRVNLLYCFMLSPIPLTLRGADPMPKVRETQVRR